MTLKAACGRPGFDRVQRPLGFIRDDLREKIKKKKGGYSVVFVVDASSSMGVQGRMSLVKGLLNAYLRECYLRRDRVALVAFRHQQSRLIQPFTGNLGRVRQSLRQLPLGGKTPLAEGLRLGCPGPGTIQIPPIRSGPGAGLRRKAQFEFFRPGPGR